MTTKPEQRRKILDAVRSGDSVSLRSLLDADPTLADATDEQGVNALMLALYHKNSDGVDALLGAGAGVGLLEAAALGDAERVSSILEPEPESVSLRSPDGFTPLHFAAFFGHTEAARRLLASGADADAVAENPSRLRPLHSACAARASEVVELLLEHDPDVNAQQAGGYTPLQAAAQHGDVEIVRMLLAAGADPSMATDDGKTAVDLAHEDVRGLLG